MICLYAWDAVCRVVVGRVEASSLVVHGVMGLNEPLSKVGFKVDRPWRMLSVVVGVWFMEDGSRD
jgi:hypothetical protein